MSLDYKGKLSLGGLCPLVVAGYATVFAEISAKIAGLVALQASLVVTPPTLALNLTLVENLQLSIQAGITAGHPGVDFQISACIAAIAALELQLVALASLNATFGAPGIYVYSWDGPAVALGPALSSELATQWRDGVPSALHANALVLGTVTPGAWSAMGTFFGGAL